MEAAPEVDPRRFVLLCLAAAAAWTVIAVALRGLGWLPEMLRERGPFGLALALGYPVLGIVLAIRTRRARARSSG